MSITPTRDPRTTGFFFGSINTFMPTPARTKEACSPKDVIRPGTPVNELQRPGSMSQVVILDAMWRWTAEHRCETVQTSPVWIQSDAITRDYPPRN